LGVPNRFIEHGTQKELYQECGFDAAGICRTVHELLNNAATDSASDFLANISDQQSVRLT